jgi:hypothetical protein
MEVDVLAGQHPIARSFLTSLAPMCGDLVARLAELALEVLDYRLRPLCWADRFVSHHGVSEQLHHGCSSNALIGAIQDC